MTFVRSFSFLTDRWLGSFFWNKSHCLINQVRCSSLLTTSFAGDGSILWGPLLRRRRRRRRGWGLERACLLRNDRLRSKQVNAAELPLLTPLRKRRFQFLVLLYYYCFGKKHIPLFYLLFFQKIHVVATSNYPCHHHG